MKRGLTLVEILIGLAILGIIGIAVTRFLVGGLETRSTVTRANAVQGDLRRLDSLTKNLLAERDFLAVMGGSSEDLSVLVARPGGEVIVDSITGSKVNVRVLGGATVEPGDLLVLRDASRVGTVLTVGSVSSNGDGLSVDTSGCTAINLRGLRGVVADRTRLVMGRVVNGERSSGDFDPESLYVFDGETPEGAPAIFNLRSFAMSYTYRAANGVQVSNPTTAQGFSDSYPQNLLEKDGVPYRLSNIALSYSKAQGDVGREYTSNVPVDTSGAYPVERLGGCGTPPPPTTGTGRVTILVRGTPTLGASARMFPTTGPNGYSSSIEYNRKVTLNVGEYVITPNSFQEARNTPSGMVNVTISPANATTRFTLEPFEDKTIYIDYAQSTTIRVGTNYFSGYTGPRLSNITITNGTTVIQHTQDNPLYVSGFLTKDYIGSPGTYTVTARAVEVDVGGTRTTLTPTLSVTSFTAVGGMVYDVNIVYNDSAATLEYQIRMPGNLSQAIVDGCTECAELKPVVIVVGQ